MTPRSPALPGVQPGTGTGTAAQVRLPMLRETVAAAQTPAGDETLWPLADLPGAAGTRRRGGTAMTITDDASPVVAHGYTVADLDTLARKAASMSRWGFPYFAERRDLACFAIAEHLLITAQAPEFWSLVHLGERAITAHVERQGRYRGIYLAQSGVSMGTAMPRFWKYWTSASEPTRSPEEAIVEVIALTQIWPRLTKSHQAVLTALATYDDYRQAAASLNKQYHSFVSSVSLARKQFLRLWHQHETPRWAWGNDVRKNPLADNRHSVTAITIRRRERRRRAQHSQASR